MLTHRAVGEDVFDDAATLVHREQAIGAPADVVFASLCRPEDWRRWAGLEVNWTSDPPHGVGSTRTARPTSLPLPGAVGAVRERFFLWDEGRRFAFHVERSPLPIPVFAEDYLVEEVADGRSVLRWTLALDGGPPPLRAAVGAAIGRIFTSGLPKLARMLERRAA